MSGDWKFGTILERGGLTVMFVKRVGAYPRFIGLDLNGPQQGRMIDYSTIGVGRPDWRAVDDPDITITARSDVARQIEEARAALRALTTAQARRLQERIISDAKAMTPRRRE